MSIANEMREKKHSQIISAQIAQSITHMPQHVFAVGYFELEVKFMDGAGENPSGGSTGIPVVKVITSDRHNLKVVSFTLKGNRNGKKIFFFVYTFQ